MQYNKPILITGADRSGSTLVTRVLELCGAFSGVTTKMRENKAIRKLTASYINLHSAEHEFLSFENISLPRNWETKVMDIFIEEGLKSNQNFFYKDSAIAQTWPVWNNAFPNAKWIIVRRRTGDIIHSCMETSYMLRFKNKKNQRAIGVASEKEGWLWWVHQYEDQFVQMLQANLNCKVVWPERMRDGNYKQMKELVAWAELTWNEEVQKTIDPLLR